MCCVLGAKNMLINATFIASLFRLELVLYAFELIAEM